MLCVMLSKDIKTPGKKNKIITFVKKKKKGPYSYEHIDFQKSNNTEILGRYELLIGFQTLGTK